jgi:hypothetical protein
VFAFEPAVGGDSTVALQTVERVRQVDASIRLSHSQAAVHHASDHQAEARMMYPWVPQVRKATVWLVRNMVLNGVRLCV